MIALLPLCGTGMLFLGVLAHGLYGPATNQGIVHFLSPIDPMLRTKYSFASIQISPTNQKILFLKKVSWTDLKAYKKIKIEKHLRVGSIVLYVNVRMKACSPAPNI